MTDNEKEEVKEVIEASNEMKYLGMICSLRADGYNRPQCQCGIMALPNEMDFNIKEILALVKDNIKVIDHVLDSIRLICKKATLLTSNDVINEVFKMEHEIFKRFPDVGCCDIFYDLTKIIANPDTNDYQKCFRIWQTIDKNYFLLDANKLN